MDELAGTQLKEILVNEGIEAVLKLASYHYRGSADAVRGLKTPGIDKDVLDGIADDYDWLAITLDPGNIKDLGKICQRLWG